MKGNPTIEQVRKAYKNLQLQAVFSVILPILSAKVYHEGERRSPRGVKHVDSAALLKVVRYCDIIAF